MADAKPVAVMDPADTHLTIVGVGGTDGFLAANAARLLWGLKQQREAAHAEPCLAHPTFGGPSPEDVPDVLLVDGDLVERRNVVRQDFRPSDIGRPKALVLAERMSPYALNVSECLLYLNAGTPFRELVPKGAIVVGCVDNAATRRILHERLLGYRDVVYHDASNGAVKPLGDGATRVEAGRQRESGWSGQVVCGGRRRGETIVPFPGDVMPDLLEGDEPEYMVPDKVPCHAVVESQPSAS